MSGNLERLLEASEDLIERALTADPDSFLAGNRQMCGSEVPEPTRTRVGAWLQLDVGVPTAPTPLAALERNRRLGGLAKFALAAEGAELRLRAELTTDAADDLPARLNAIEGAMFEAAWGASARSARLPPPAALAAGVLAETCAAAGWPFTASGSHKIAVDLQLRELFARARVEHTAETDAVRVSAELDAVPLPLTDGCADALAVFLLRTAAVVRLVRPFIDYRPAHAALGFEAVFTTLPTSRELGHALAALRVAAEMTSREVAVLARDATVARAYLALHDIPTQVGTFEPITTASTTLDKGETQ